MNIEHLSIFDLDYTLFQANSSYAFGRYLTRHRVLPWWTPFTLFIYKMQFQWGSKTLEKLHNQVHLTFMQGLSLPLLETSATRFLDQKFSRLVNPSIAGCLHEAKATGHKTVILSSSPQFLVEAVAKRVGADIGEGTSYQTDSQNRITTIDSLIDGPSKAKYVLKLAAHYALPPSAITAYTDSFHDLPMLEVVGNPIAVNPDRKLRRHCQLNQWTILGN